MDTKRTKQEKKNKLAAAKKEFTREKALAELNKGADPKDSTFTTHRNYHVRQRAFHLAYGGQPPADEAERKGVFDRLVKNRSDEGTAKLKTLFGYN